MYDEGLLQRRFCKRLQMFVENSMRGSFFLAFRSHREETRPLFDHHDRIVEINNPLVLIRGSGDLLARRDRHNVAGLELSVVPDVRHPLHVHGLETQ
jgi:hypothetical protein